MSLFKNLFRTNKATLFRSKPSRPSNRTRPTLESLESRALLAADPIAAPLLAPQSMDIMELAAQTSVVSVKVAGQSGKVVDPEPELSGPALVGLSGQSKLVADPDPELASPEARMLSIFRDARGFLDGGPFGDGQQALPQPGEQPDHFGPLSEHVPGRGTARPPLPWEQADMDPEAVVDGLLGSRRSDRPSDGGDSGTSPFARVGWVSDDQGGDVQTWRRTDRDSSGYSEWGVNHYPDGSRSVYILHQRSDDSSSFRSMTRDRDGTVREYYRHTIGSDESSQSERVRYHEDGSVETITTHTNPQGETQTKHTIEFPQDSQPSEGDTGNGLSLLGSDPWLLFFAWYTDTGDHPDSMAEWLARIRATHTDSWDTGDGGGGGSGDAAPRVGPEAVTNPQHHAGVVTSGGYRAPGGGGLPVDPEWPGSGGSPSR